MSFAVAIICGYVVFYFVSTLFCHCVIVTSLFGVESCLNYFFYDSFNIGTTELFKANCVTLGTACISVDNSLRFHSH